MDAEPIQHHQQPQAASFVSSPPISRTVTEQLKRLKLETRGGAYLRSSVVRPVRRESAGARAVAPSALKSLKLPCVFLFVCF